MSLYQFSIWNRYFVVDVGSGNFFEVDKLASDALALLENHTQDETKKKLSLKYDNTSLDTVFKTIAVLRKKSFLFSSKHRKTPAAKRRITDLTLNIVNNCNLRCRYCWNEAGAYGSQSQKDTKMAFGVAKDAIDLLMKESGGTKDLVVDFYGGEPLINFDLIKEVIEYCRAVKDRKKINFRFLLATNGTLLDRQKGMYLIKNGVDVAVSLDGPRKVQDAQRPFSGGKGSFDRVKKNLYSLGSAHRRRLVGRATFTPYSKDTVKTFQFLRSFGFDRIEVCESEKAGYGLQEKNKFFFCGKKGVEQLKGIYDALARFYAQEIIDGKLNYENTYFNRFFKQLSRLYHIQSIVGTCSAGFSLMAVDMEGSIYPCTAFVGIPQFAIGNVKTGISDRLLEGFLSAKISSSTSCGKCWARSLCRGCGSCYNLNYFSNNSAGTPDPYYCELFRHKTKLMIAMIAEINHKNPARLEEVLIPEYYATRGRRSSAPTPSS